MDTRNVFLSIQKSQTFQNLHMQKMTVFRGQREGNSRFAECVCFFKFIFFLILGFSVSFRVKNYPVQNLKRESYVFNLQGIFFNPSGHLQPLCFANDTRIFSYCDINKHRFGFRMRQYIYENKQSSSHKHDVRYCKKLPPPQFKMTLACTAITANVKNRFKNSHFTTHKATSVPQSNQYEIRITVKYQCY